MRPDNRELVVYGALLAVGLGAAYWASMPVAEGEEEKITVVSLEPKSIGEVTFKGKDGTATAVRREDGRFWVTHERRELPPAAPPPPVAKPGEPAPPPPAPPEPGKLVTERFLSNDKMAELTAAFNPMRAERVIGSLDDKQLEEFGLKEKTDSVAVKTDGGKVLTYWLGKKSYGSRNRFVMEEGGRVLLVDDQGFENLEKANLRLYERRLIPFELDDVTRAKVSAGDKTRVMAHTQRDKSGELVWSDEEEGAPPKVSYGTWMDKIGKLRLTAYAEPAEEQQLQQTAPFLTVTFEKGDKALDTVTFKKTAGEPPVYWIYSEYMKAHAKVVPARVEPIVKDAASIIAGGAS